MKPWIYLLSLFLFCNANATTKISIPDIDKSATVVVKDLRPASEKENKFFSLLITNEQYGIMRRGDKLLSPAAPRILQHRVFEKFESSTSPVELNIYHLVVYWNSQAEFRRTSMFAALGGGVVAAIAVGSQKNGVNIAETLIDHEALEALDGKEEFKRGLYSEAENPNKAGVFIVYIDAEINGKRVCVRTLSPASTKTKQDPLYLAVESAISYYLQQY